MLTQKAFADALQGNDSELVAAAGPDGFVVVEPALASAIAVADEVVLARRSAGGEVALTTLSVPDWFTVRKVTADEGRFTLHGPGTWVVRGTPEEFAGGDLVELLFDPYDDMVKADLALSEEHVAEIARVGEVVVPMGEDHVWVSFDHARPEEVVELVPTARALLASFEQHGRTGAEFLLGRVLATDEDEEDTEEDTEEDADEDTEEDADEDTEEDAEEDAEDDDADGTGDVGDGEEEDDGEEFDPDAFLAAMEPSGLVVHEGGAFSVHYESASDGTYFLDNYWPSVRFTADGTAVDYTIEA